jgi:hypothetical protein
MTEIRFACTPNKNLIVFLSVNYIDTNIDKHRKPQGEAYMRLTIAAATVAIAALVSAPALAEHVQGGPVKQSGQCWKGSKGSDGGSFGSWGACPTSASTPAAPQKRVRHHS